MSVLLWPFRMIWGLLELVLQLTGRLLAAIIGFTLMMVGIVLTLTIVGSIVGIPMCIVGFSLFLRSLF